MASTIPDSAVSGEYGAGYGGASASSGRELDHHITALYGLKTTNPEDVRKVLAGEPPIKVTFGETSVFKNDEGDVLKLDIDSPDLHRLNAKLAELPNSNTFPTYKPHATLAYLKPGYGKDFAGDRTLAGKSVVIDKVRFSGADGKSTDIKLGGTAKPPVDA